MVLIVKLVRWHPHTTAETREIPIEGRAGASIFSSTWLNTNVFVLLMLLQDVKELLKVEMISTRRLNLLLTRVRCLPSVALWMFVLLYKHDVCHWWLY